MTRAQIEAARERVALVLVDDDPCWVKMPPAQRDKLCSRLVTAVLGHPDGRAPRVKPVPARRTTR